MTLPVAATALMGLLLLAQAKPPTFRSGTHGVPVTVAVFDGDRVVRGLTAQDFQIKDNGAEQMITSADFNTLPIDLRLVFDTSGSISAADLAHFLRAMNKVTAALEPRDVCEIVVFNARIAEAAARQSPPVVIKLQRDGPDGTAFFDAVMLSLATVPTPDRRQITIVLSDAKDNASFFDEAAMLEVARRTDAVVYTILPGDPKTGSGVSVARLEALSALTGGRLARSHKETVGDFINDAIEEFRQSYVVRYDLVGPRIEGWHKLEIKVRGGNSFRIRARAGYFGR